jgi:hypothetical protein
MKIKTHVTLITLYFSSLVIDSIDSTYSTKFLVYFDFDNSLVSATDSTKTKKIPMKGD